MNIFTRSQHWLDSVVLRTGNPRDSCKEDRLYFCLPIPFVYYHLCVCALWSTVIFPDLHGFIVGHWHRSDRWFFLNLPIVSNSRQVNANSEDIQSFSLMGWITRDVSAWFLESKRMIFLFKGTFINHFPRCVSCQKHTMAHSWEFGALF